MFTIKGGGGSSYWKYILKFVPNSVVIYLYIENNALACRLVWGLGSNSRTFHPYLIKSE